MISTPRHTRLHAGLRLLGLLLVAAFALFLGLFGATAGWFGQVVLVSIILSSILLFINFKLALYLLVFLIPLSDAKFWPKIGPLSVINILLLGVVAMHVLRRLLDSISGKDLEALLPKEFVLLYWLPVTLGFVIGSLHLHEIPAYVVALEEKVADQNFYWVTLYTKGMLIPVAAFILASSVGTQSNGRRVIYLSLASGVVLVLVGTWGWLMSGVSFESAVRGRSIFVFTGNHPNSIGFFLLPLIGVALYLRSGVAGLGARALLIFTTIVLIAGVVLSGSRAGLLGLFLLIAFVLVGSRDIRVFVIAGLLALGAVFLAPDAVLDRLSLGVGQTLHDGTFVAKGDQLTSGRLYVYRALIDDIAANPLLGGGITSIRWSDLVKSGYYLSHAHSFFVSLLLDLGIIGAIALIAFAVAFFRLCGRLASSESIDPVMRKCFLGMKVGFVGYLGCSVGTGDPYPTHEQWFLWICVALAFRYRSHLRLESSKSIANPTTRLA